MPTKCGNHVNVLNPNRDISRFCIYLRSGAFFSIFTSRLTKKMNRQFYFNFCYYRTKNINYCWIKNHEKWLFWLVEKSPLIYFEIFRETLMQSVFTTNNLWCNNSQWHHGASQSHNIKWDLNVKNLLTDRRIFSRQ